MLLSVDKVIEQFAYYIISLDDPKKAGMFIFECLQGSGLESPTDVQQTQSIFMEVTRLVSQIDSKYSLQCSKEYLRLIQEVHGTSAELEKLINQGEEYE